MLKSGSCADDRLIKMFCKVCFPTFCSPSELKEGGLRVESFQLSCCSFSLSGERYQASKPFFLFKDCIFLIEVFGILEIKELDFL